MEAKTKCSELDSSSTLITITSEEEQNYLVAMLNKHHGIGRNVWLGLEYVNNSFKWLDGNELKYENWSENAVKDGNSKCVQISLSDNEHGKWTDDLCERKYLIACQKPTHNDKLNQDIQNLKGENNVLKGKNFNY